MEARGIEPRSENRSTTASTCVAYQLRSPGAGRQATHPWTSSLEFRPAPESAPRGYPEFAIPMKPPRASFPMGRCSNAMRYAARAKLSLAVVIFPSVLPGTRGPGHAATASLTPSKPVAPVARNLIESADQINQRLDLELPRSGGVNSLWRQRLGPLSERDFVLPPSPDTAPDPLLGRARHASGRSPDRSLRQRRP